MKWDGQGRLLRGGDICTQKNEKVERKLTKSIADRGKSKCKGPGAGKNFPCTKRDGLDIS